MGEVVRPAASCYSDVRMPENTASDIEFMRAALAEARDAAERGEVPIGAVLTLDDRIIARAGNRTISDCDPTAHAEIVALRAASKIIGNYRLLGATLYVTIEPCAMCCGAMIQARISRLVYGADDAKAGRCAFLLLRAGSSATQPPRRGHLRRSCRRFRRDPQRVLLGQALIRARTPLGRCTGIDEFRGNFLAIKSEPQRLGRYVKTTIANGASRIRMQSDARVTVSLGESRCLVLLEELLA